MIDLEASSAKDVERKIKDCLRWSNVRTDRRPHLPSNDLTFEHLLDLLKRQSYRCALTNIALTKSGPQSATIDRIEGHGGYRQRNVRWVAKFANSAKGTMPDLEFMGWWEAFKNDIRRGHI
jgi:hypothetical protein